MSASNVNVKRQPSRKFHERAANSGELQRRNPSKVSISTNSPMSQIYFEKRGEFKVPKYQNSYRLESYNPFNVGVIDKIVKDIMELRLSPVTKYQHDDVAKLCCQISEEIRTAIWKKDFDRYKIVVQVGAIQRLFQSFNVGMRCLWDVERDNYSYYVFENNDLYAWCCVFGVYYE